MADQRVEQQHMSWATFSHLIGFRSDLAPKLFYCDLTLLDHASRTEACVHLPVHVVHVDKKPIPLSVFGTFI